MFRLLLCSLLLNAVGCGKEPTSPGSGSARVWVASDAFTEYVDATLITDNPPYQTSHVTRGQTYDFRPLALGVRYTVSLTWPDSTGAINGTARHLLLTTSGESGKYFFEAGGFSGTPDQW